MKIHELKNALYEIVCMYFASANVMWSEGSYTVPKKPMACLRLRSAGKATHAIEVMRGGVLQRCYPSRAVLEVNLFTDGRKVYPGAEMTPVFENTAVADMEDFCNFMCSHKAEALFDRKDITVLQKGDITDVTALLDGVEHEYRAMVEFDVTYTQRVEGAYGVSRPLYENDDNETDAEAETESASGGRTETLVTAEVGYFTSAEVESEE